MPVPRRARLLKKWCFLEIAHVTQFQAQYEATRMVNHRQASYPHCI
jgi:hypothetical protein